MSYFRYLFTNCGGSAGVSISPKELRGLHIRFILCVNLQKELVFETHIYVKIKQSWLYRLCRGKSRTWM
jgi:hypothetical protein